MGLVLEFWGRGAGVQNKGPASPGPPPGVCDPLQPARFPALPEGAETPWLAHGPQRGAQERFGYPRKRFRVSPESISGAIFNRPSTIQPSKHYFQPTSAPKRARESSDPAEMIEVLCHDPFFGVGGSGRRPSRMCNLLRGAWGRQAAVSWGRALVASLVPSFLVPGLVSGVVSIVVATLAPLRHASNLGGHFHLCSLLPAVS